jgi:hypothetical protein
MSKDVLHHYCSTSAFHSIIENRSIRLSSLTLSNDSQEGKMIERVMTELASEAGINSSHVERLREMIGIFSNLGDGLGFCLSENGDVLSQWRGYADDGSGVSIGFSSDYLEWLGRKRRDRDEALFVLRQVEYRAEEHRHLIAPILDEVEKCIEAGAFDTPGLTILSSKSKGEIEEARAKTKKAHLRLGLTVLPLFSHLFVLKSDAFQEEEEWRLISIFSKASEDTCSHHAAEDRIIRHRDFALEELERGPVVEVTLGPKHQTPVENVKSFLDQNGFEEVSVKRSRATYR